MLKGRPCGPAGIMDALLRNSDRLRLASILLVLAVLLLVPSQATCGRLLGIRTGNYGDDSLRVVLDLEGKVSCSFGSVEGSEDWVAILPDFCPVTAPPLHKDSHPLLRRIETRCDGSVLRVRLVTRRPTRARTLLLPEGNGKPWRFVIDLGRIKGPPTGPTPMPVQPEPLPRRQGKWRILVDPGHGGKDPGASARGLVEKKLVLDVGKRITNLLNETPGFEARLTRSSDTFLNLRRRMRVAEEYEADAFLSVHANAVRKGRAKGVEVFFLSLGGASDEASRELARLENESDPDYVVEEDALLQGIPFGFDLRQNDTILRSSRLAEMILTALERSRLAASRGVKQAGFRVLKSYQVPSILVEIGFISNPAEAQRLKKASYRQQLAGTIASGTVAYFEDFARSHDRQGTGSD
jgi:N-acetylmuramoyl-L-alanine amidase